MAAKIRDMTVGKPAVLFIGFALPLMAGNVFQQFYIVVDTAIVGKALGVDALAALGAVDWLNYLMYGMVQAITQGFGIYMAKQFGAKDYDELKNSIGCSVMLAAIIALLFAVSSECLLRPVLVLLKTPQRIMGGSVTYLRYMFAGLPITMCYNLCAAILRALGDGKTPLDAMILGAFSNIGMDLLFVLVFKWGIAGAAVATLIAQLLASVFCYLHLRKVNIIRLERKNFALKDSCASKLGILSMPLAIQNATIAVGGIVIQLVVNTCGVLFIAGVTASNKLYGILEVAATSYGYAMTTYTSQNLGAGNMERIRKGARAGYIISILTSVIISVIMLAFGKYFLALFISGTPQEVEGAMKVAFEYLAVMSIFLSVLYIGQIARALIQGMGNTVFSMISGVVELIMRTSMVFILPVFMGDIGIFFAEAAAWAGGALILIPGYFIMLKRTAYKLQHSD